MALSQLSYFRVSTFPRLLSLRLLHGIKAFDRASLIPQLVRNPPAIQETLVRFLGCEDTLEKGMATRSSILAWRIPSTVQSMGHKDTTEPLSLSAYTYHK